MVQSGVHCSRPGASVCMYVELQLACCSCSAGSSTVFGSAIQQRPHTDCQSYIGYTLSYLAFLCHSWLSLKALLASSLAPSRSCPAPPPSSRTLALDVCRASVRESIRHVGACQTQQLGRVNRHLHPHGLGRRFHAAGNVHRVCKPENA